MNKEEIDYWLRLFSNNNHCFMSKDGKKITLFKVFQELKELHYLLKIKNDYIKQLQQENQSLKKENKILRENAEHNDKVVDKTNWENLKLKNQQKEFIEYLENEKNIYSYDISDYIYENIINTILSKYKEIIEK